MRCERFMSRTDSRCFPAIQVRPFPSVRSHVRRQGWLHAPRLPLRADIDRERKQRPLYPTQTAPWTKHSTSAAVAAQMARDLLQREVAFENHPRKPRLAQEPRPLGRAVRNLRRGVQLHRKVHPPQSHVLHDQRIDARVDQAAACRSAASSSSSHTSVLSVAWTRTPKRWAYSTTRAISSAEFPAALPRAEPRARRYRPHRRRSPRRPRPAA